MRAAAVALSLAWLLSTTVAVRGEEGMTTHRPLTSGGLARSYELHTPPPTGGTAARLPLLLVFHGLGDSGTGLMNASGFNAIADQHGFVVAYPNALYHPELLLNSWFPLAGGMFDGNDAFIGDVLRDVGAHQPIDPHRIFITGMSQGGLMCWLAANLYPDVFGAIAPVVADLSPALPPETVLPPRPLPVLMINGTLDPLVPYLGGSSGNPLTSGVSLLALPELAARTAAHDGCFPWPFRFDIPNWNWFDGCTASVTIYFAGAQGSEVELITVNGGGHTWPGSRTWVPTFLFGNACYDFDASAAIWDFCKRHPLPSGTAN